MAGLCLKVLSGLVALAAVFVGSLFALWPQWCCPFHTLQELPASWGDPCASTGRGLAADLRERGWAKVPGVLSAEDIETLLEMQRKASWELHGTLPGFKQIDLRMSQVITREVQDKMQGMVDEIDGGWGFPPIGRIDKAFGRPEFLVTNASAPDKMTTEFPWHQDHGFGWESGTKYSLGFYFMLRKPSASEAGIMIVPMDRLKAQSPSFYETAKENAGVWYSPIPNYTGMVADVQMSVDEMHVLDYHLDNISCTPEVVGGDLMILRGDILHRTQPHNSYRLSVNYRLAPDSFSVASLAGGQGQFDFQAQASHYYVNRSIRELLGKGNTTCNGIKYCPYEEPEGWKDRVLVAAEGARVHLYLQAGNALRRTLRPWRFYIGWLMGEEMWPWQVPSAPMSR